jgi:drug/metabolite transporter (DMT)-like permease
LRYVPVAVVALITLCTPLVVFPLSYFMLRNQEQITIRTLAGGALTLAGIAVLVLR